MVEGREEEDTVRRDTSAASAISAIDGVRPSASSLVVALTMALRVRRRCRDLPTVLVSFGMPPLYSALTGHTAMQLLRPALDPDIEVGKWSPVGGHALLGVQEIETDDVAAYLSQVGNVFVVHRGHDSNNSSAGLTIQAESWFVKWATDPEAVSYLESGNRFGRFKSGTHGS